MRAPVPTALQRRAWETVLRTGTQMAAAKELGMTQGAVRSHLLAYARHTGHTGPIPGFRTIPQPFVGTPSRTERRLQRIVGRAGGTVEHGPVDEHGNVTHLLVNVPERGPDR